MMVFLLTPSAGRSRHASHQALPAARIFGRCVGVIVRLQPLAGAGQTILTWAGGDIGTAIGTTTVGSLLVAVPEPSTYALLLLGGFGLALNLVKRRPPDARR